jgi:hypothetical protein
VLVALLGVLIAGACGAYAVFAASAPATPTITPTPATSPTSAAVESLAFSSSSATSYQCSLNGSVFTACTSPKAYGTVSVPQAEGSYAFQVKAFDSKNNASGVASYSWVVDRTAPSVQSILPASPTPTNASAVTWTVKFSEPVVGVQTTNFTLTKTGLGGTPSVTSASGSGSTWTVTASTGTGDGSLQLNVATNLSQIKDSAGNALSAAFSGGSASQIAIDRTAPPTPTISSGPTGTGNPATAQFGFVDSESGVSFLCKLDAGSYVACPNPATFSGLSDGSHTLTVEATDAAGNVSNPSPSRIWSVDATPPPRPSVTNGPNNKWDSSTATFTFTDSEAGVRFQCNMDLSSNPGWQACTSPQAYYNVASGTHEFDVRAVDAAGNIGDYNGWKWSENGQSGSGQAFTISGNGSAALFPGGTSYLNLSLTNPNSVPIYVSSLTVTFGGVAGPNVSPATPCGSGDYLITQFGGGISTANPITLPAKSTETLAQLGFAQAQLPRVQMLNRHVKQDGCKGATLTLNYTGNAQS